MNADEMTGWALATGICYFQAGGGGVPTSHPFGDAMPAKRLLRVLIVAEIGLAMVGVVLSLLTEPTLPQPLREYMAADAAAEITGRDLVMLAAGIAFVVLVLVSSVGLFIFWRPARVVYIVTTAMGLVLIPLFGPYIDAGWGTVFEHLAALVSGIILTLIYVSPLKDLYK